MATLGDEDDFEDIIDNYEFQEEEEEEDPFVITSTGSEADEIFDQTIEKLERIALDVEGEFPSVLKNFMRENCHVFEEGDENPHMYMDIFQMYATQIESFLEEELRKEMPEFAMNSFLKQLEDREDEISPDTLELLTSLADFQTFKEMMICEKNSMQSPSAGKEKRHEDLCVFGRESRIFSEEVEDGVARPDLNLQIRCHDSPERPRKRIFIG